MAAPKFIETDPLVILDLMVTDYQARTGRKLEQASVEYIMIQTMAYMLSLTQAGVQYSCEQQLVGFSTAPTLDYIGAAFGVTRLAATPASVEVEFQLVPGHGGVTIPEGTRIATTDGAQVFETVEDITVSIGINSAIATVECQTLGAGGNGYVVGTVANILDPQSYLSSVNNSTVTGGGADEEVDDDLRTRIKLAPASFSTAGPFEAYKFHARSANPGISDVAVLSSAPGQVDLYPLMSDGSTTSASVLAAVEAACNDERVRPQNDTVVVTAPTSVAWSLAADLTIYTTADGAAVQAAAETALAEFAAAKRQTLGQDIIDSQIYQAIHNSAPGSIFDIDLGVFTDVTVGDTQYPLAGTLTITINPTTTNG